MTEQKDRILRIWGGWAFTVWAPFGVWFLIPRRYYQQGWEGALERILMHERVHRRQIGEMGPLKFYWRYFTSRTWRLKLEGPAYAQSVRWWWNREVTWYKPNVSVVDHYAEKLATKYRLKVTPERARQEILAWL